MSNVLLISDDRGLVSSVQEASAGNCIVLPQESLVDSPAAVVARVGMSALPDVIILDTADDPERALSLAARFDQELPGTGIILAGNIATLSPAAMRVGARDVLAPDSDVDAVRLAIEHVTSLAIQRRLLHPEPSGAASGGGVLGRVLTVLSPKGGAGKTTVAVNLAIGLAGAGVGPVVLVDLDVQFGDVATALNIDPEFTLEDVVRGAALRDPIALKTHLSRHESGLSVVCAPESAAVADTITPEQVGALLQMLATQFRFVVVDTAAGLNATTLAALDQTTDPLLLSTLDVMGGRGLRKEMSTLRELGMLTSARQVVLNFADPRSGLSVADVESTIQASVDLTLPHSRAVTASMNTGVPLILQKPRDPVAKQLLKLLHHYATTPAQAVRELQKARS
ncbi:AAA family ATPase [Agrococcus sp. KRD186]|uniref:AAA family ATPase n=1 Tax=Agrococcus sp. KRD186 TaxID=2729730 RepID=UPI0019D121EB|nr:AAA family ATPase [Agrococcus sp. KRD186]